MKKIMVSIQALALAMGAACFPIALEAQTAPGPGCMNDPNYIVICPYLGPTVPWPANLLACYCSPIKPAPNPK